ncbi:MAG: NifB/NifX family molybdenum-iron cluster-binding protein [Pseudomonadota bacterium]
MAADETSILAVPCNEPAGLGASIAPHFGRAPCYAILRVSGGQVHALHFIANARHQPASCMQPVQRLLVEGVRVIVVRGIGARGLAGLQQLGVEVLDAGIAGTVEEAWKAWGDQLLERLGPSAICDGQRGQNA